MLRRGAMAKILARMKFQSKGWCFAFEAAIYMWTDMSILEIHFI